MDQLEKIITAFKDEMQDENPLEGHFERFELKLETQKKNKTFNRIRYIASLAAILAIALLVYKSNFNNTKTKTLSDLSNQYADVEYYYTSSINKQVKLLNKLNSEIGGDQTIKTLTEEIKAYDKMYEQLCNELNATPNDERVINAMITYYQTKLEIINKILNEIKNKHSKTKNNENINI